LQADETRSQGRQEAGGIKQQTTGAGRARAGSPAASTQVPAGPETGNEATTAHGGCRDDDAGVARRVRSDHREARGHGWPRRRCRRGCGRRPGVALGGAAGATAARCSTRASARRQTSSRTQLRADGPLIRQYRSRGTMPTRPNVEPGRPRALKRGRRPRDRRRLSPDRSQRWAAM
jgi:hypothetical protein